MGPGGHLEAPYTLHGPIPAGRYRLVAHGYQSAMDAVLHAEVLYRPGGSDAGVGADGGAYQVIVSADGRPPTDAGSEMFLDVTVSGAAVPAVCGDTLLYRVTYVSGSTSFYDLYMELDIP